MRDTVKSLPVAVLFMTGCVLDMDPADMPPPGDTGTDEAVATDTLVDTPAGDVGVDIPLDEADGQDAPDYETSDWLDSPDFAEVMDIPDSPDFMDSADLPDITDIPLEEAPPHSGVGAACETNEDCTPWSELEPECLDTISGVADFPGGYCTVECEHTDQCGSEAECVSLMFVTYCIRDCVTTDECRVDEGYECREIPFVTEDTYCLPSVW